MNYPTFAFLILGGLALTFVLALLRVLTPLRFSWFAVPFPLFTGWFLTTYDVVWATFEWHYQPPFPWSYLALALVAFALVLFACILRAIANNNREPKLRNAH